MSTPTTGQPETSAPVALVTGAGRRVGNVIARALADKGYSVVLHARGSLADAERTAAELCATGTRAIAISADLGQAHEVRAMVEQAHREFGHIDALVNNASVWKAAPLEKVTEADLRQNFEANQLSMFLCCQQVGLIMTSQSQGGAIVNIGDWAIARPYVNHAAYFATKGAVPALTRTFAVELAARNPRVRVNAVLPGPVLLPEHLTAAERRSAIEGTLVKREGSPANIAHAILFLLENDFVTGVCIPVDGGRSVYAADAV